MDLQSAIGLERERESGLALRLDFPHPCFTCMSNGSPVFFTCRSEGILLGYLLSEKGDNGGVWKTSRMEISMVGNHHVGVIGRVSNDWSGTMAFTNIVLEEGSCSEGAVLFFFILLGGHLRRTGEI